MKKRSLVAALAMLMVSAIVLTSSTYAWFATGTTAKISGVSATVVNADGNITISANGTDYSTTLEYTAFQGQGGNFTPGEFKPVSFNPGPMTFVSGAIVQGEDEGDTATFGKLVFQPALATNDADKFIKLNVYLKASVDCDVNIAADMQGSTYQFIYAAVYENDDTSNYQVYNVASRTYVPVETATAGIDVDTNGIMNADKDTNTDGSSDYSGLADSAVATSTNAPITVKLTKDTPKNITLYVWAEGNDDLCVGTIGSQSCAVALNFTKVS